MKYRFFFLWGILFFAHEIQAQKKKIEWLTFEEAIERSSVEPKKIFVDVYTDWCAYCKKMDFGPFKDPEIIDYINTHFYAVKFNAEIKKTILFDGKKYKFVSDGNNGHHELAAALTQGNLSYPSLVFMNEEQLLIQSIPGFKNKKKLHLILSFMEEAAMKEIPWNEYQRQYHSPYAKSKNRKKQ